MAARHKANFIFYQMYQMYTCALNFGTKETEYMRHCLGMFGVRVV